MWIARVRVGLVGRSARRGRRFRLHHRAAACTASADPARHGYEHGGDRRLQVGGEETARRYIRSPLLAPRARIRLQWAISGTDAGGATADPAWILHW
uniref:Uncharacterized protein n=1 Tax=Oryza sativa subsp. japonica TaxID=39947 RepID=Q6YTA9_ORYSJ|nr:hypothetical protein [Oryza sativa Japonica Group]BAC99948.1 hypothetical protein [Oryza sativa Japonica Group]